MHIASKALLSAAVLISGSTYANPIANWQVLSGSTPVFTDGLNTDSPTFGDGTAANFQSYTIGSLFGANGAPESVLLESVGDVLTVTSEVTLTGGSASAGSQYRLAVVNDNGNFGTSTSGFAGGWNHIIDNDLYSSRTTSNFMSNASDAVDLNADKSSSGSFSGNSTAPYTWTMSITRSSATTVDIVSSFNGGDGSLSQTYSALGSTTSVFEYTALGFLSGGASSLGQVSFANAQYTKSFTPITLFSDDFEAYTPGVTIPTSGPWNIVNTGATDRWVTRDEGTSTLFGSPNQYGELNDNSSSASIRMASDRIAEAAGAVTTYSFDFFEVSGGGDGDMLLGYSINNLDLNGTGSRQLISLNDGTIGNLSSAESNTYALDTAYTLYMIFNDTGDAVDYDGGTIEAGDAHIWLEELDSGNFVFAGISGSSNTATAATDYRVGFRSFSSVLQNIGIDNVSLVTGAAAVPEPSSLALLGLGGLLLARRRRI